MGAQVAYQLGSQCNSADKPRAGQGWEAELLLRDGPDGREITRVTGEEAETRVQGGFQVWGLDDWTPRKMVWQPFLLPLPHLQAPFNCLQFMHRPNL